MDEAWKVYTEARARAVEAYEEAKVPIRAAYEKAIDQAWEDYMKALAQAEKPGCEPPGGRAGEEICHI